VAKTFDDSKTRVPLQGGRVAREGEALREGAGQGPPRASCNAPGAMFNS